jgi:hypothetical protein
MESNTSNAESPISPINFNHFVAPDENSGVNLGVI